MKHISAVIIFDPISQSFLMQHRDSHAENNPNKWGLFGGGAEDDETPVQTAKRELKEEIGLDFDESEINLWMDYPGTSVHRYVFVVTSKIDSSKIVLGEGQGFEWIPKDKVLTYDLTLRTRNDIETFLNRLKNSL